MSDTVESSVDPKLDSFLGQDLPGTSGARVDTGNTAEEFNTESGTPVSESTLKTLLYYLSQGLSTKEANEILELMREVQELNEEQAQTLIRGLRVKCNVDIDGDLSKLVIKEMTKATFNPNDKKRKRSAKQSKYINRCVSEGLSELVGNFGWWAGLVVFGIYAAASWRYNPDKNEAKKRRIEGEIEKET